MMRDLMAALVASSLLISSAIAEVTHISESKGLRVSINKLIKFSIDHYFAISFRFPQVPSPNSDWLEMASKMTI